MLERMKKSLVDSFVGAIALGWVFAQAVVHFAYSLAAPISSWLSRNQYRDMFHRTDLPTGFRLTDAVPELMKSLALLLLGYLLLRWLYRKRLEPVACDVRTFDSQVEL
jgi:hypothetical protein